MSVVIKHPLSNGIFTIKYNNNNFIFTYNHLTDDIKYKKYELCTNKETILNTNPLFQLDFDILYTIIENIPKIVDFIENRVSVLYEIYILGNKYNIEFVLPSNKLTPEEEKKMLIYNNKINTDYLLRQNRELKDKLQLEKERTYYLLFNMFIFIVTILALKETIYIVL